MRGANSLNLMWISTSGETSPHAWSKHQARIQACDIHGNISTCVEQTSGRRGQAGQGRKHLHMRGANLVLQRCNGCNGETSPHAWSKHCHRGDAEMRGGNISTCVEQTATSSVYNSLYPLNVSYPTLFLSKIKGNPLIFLT